ncbi:restriction endonuclease subunit S [Campylobacter hyointestinalis]|uniref:Restriction endonuclease subunit S n=1 Tax=Campylobacter hyointestinalis subsp. lawsonii TaxID=91353 RepID=A0AAV6EGU5_CAMHY|nr:restriction endonuclease subunit S [Campylobacter hyointestinalis]KAB0613194.1 restriction endonuclease subunit S [Campylobacter hyointestinalis subsp. lawsonii]QKF69211.1 type I restriction/modification system, specificity subunit [Campylobacter hyointestinalis subsp. lawsonii]RAZ29594.1 restriction endonuclease subunit S [Campylobacter hyointestinalis subsp. lawsonii]
MKSRILEFKDSGISWIGQIPKHWEVKRLKFTLNERKENNKPVKTDFILSLTNEKGVIPYSEKGAQGNISKDDITGYKLAYPNDIILNSMNVVIGSVGLSSYFGAISPVYYALYSKENSNIKFYNYIFQTSVFQNSLKGLGNGILEIRMRIPMSNLNNVFLPYPPLNEQKKIAEFLDKKCEIIDKRVENLERKINTLKEYKKSLISECVTKGLNPKILKFKDSGIPWIGQIPKHWEIKKLKYIATKIYKGNGITKEQVFENGDMPCVRYGEIYTKYNYSFDECFSYTFEKVLNSTSYFGYGDILFTCTGELIEEIGKNVVYLGHKKCLAGGDIIILNHKQNPSFLNYALDCNYARNQKSYGKAKLKVVHISSREISNLFVVLPPLNEQKEIAEFLDKKCEKIDRLNENYTKQITTLKEYKKSLIYECVTGKKEI